MKRLVLTLIGSASLLATGCCCDWCNWCQPCCNPCGSACGPTYGPTYAAPPGAYYTPYGAPALGAVAAPAVTTYVPVESLPTY